MIYSIYLILVEHYVADDVEYDVDIDANRGFSNSCHPWFLKHTAGGVNNRIRNRLAKGKFEIQRLFKRAFHGQNANKRSKEVEKKGEVGWCQRLSLRPAVARKKQWIKRGRWGWRYQRLSDSAGFLDKWRLNLYPFWKESYERWNDLSRVFYGVNTNMKERVKIIGYPTGLTFLTSED